MRSACAWSQSGWGEYSCCGTERMFRPLTVQWNLVMVYGKGKFWKPGVVNNMHKTKQFWIKSKSYCKSILSTLRKTPFVLSDLLPSHPIYLWMCIFLRACPVSALCRPGCLFFPLLWELYSLPNPERFIYFLIYPMKISAKSGYRMWFPMGPCHIFCVSCFCEEIYLTSESGASTKES